MSIQTSEHIYSKTNRSPLSRTTISEHTANVDKAFYTDKFKDNNRTASLLEQQEPHYKRYSRTDSDEFKRFTYKTNKLKKSKLTLPNKPTPLPRTSVHTGANDSDELESADELLSYDGHVGKGKPTHKHGRDARRDTQTNARVANTERGAQISSQKLLNRHGSSSSNNVQRSSMGDAKITSKQKDVNGINPKEENKKFHQIWSILRYLNTYQFKATPRISEESLVPRKKKSRKPVRRKSPVRVAAPTEYSEEMGSVTMERNEVKSVQLKERTKAAALSNERFNITKNIYLSKNNAAFIKDKKIRKPLNHSLDSSYRQSYKGKVIQSARPQIKNAVENKVSLKKCNGFVKSGRTESYKGCSSRISDNGSINTAVNVSFRKPMSGKSIKNTLNKVRLKRISSPEYSTASSKFTASILKDANEKFNIGQNCDAKSSKSYEHSSDYVCGSVRSAFHHHETANKRKLRLNTTIPTHNLTLNEIKRKISQLHFPIVVLGKNEVSSSVIVPDYDPLQFQGLNDQIWPFMKNWIRNKNSSEKGAKEQTKTLSSRMQKSKEPNFGELNIKHRKDTTQRNKTTSHKVNDNMLKILFQKSNVSGERGGDYAYSIASKPQNPAFNRTMNKDFYSFDESMIPKRQHSGTRSTQKCLKQKPSRPLRYLKMTEKVEENTVVELEDPHRHVKNTYGEVYSQNSVDEYTDSIHSSRKINQSSGENENSSSQTSYTRQQHTQKSGKMFTVECNTNYHRNNEKSSRDRLYTAQDSIIVVKDQSMNTVRDESMNIDRESRKTRIRKNIDRDNFTASVKIGLNRSEDTKTTINPFKNIQNNSSKTDNESQSIRRSLTSSSTLKDVTPSKVTVCSSKEWWRITQINQSLINSESKNKFNAIPKVPARSTANYISSKRSGVIVQNAIKMLELGYFYNGDDPVENSEATTSIYNIPSVDTLVGKNLELQTETNIENQHTESIIKIPGFGDTSLSDIEIKKFDEFGVEVKNCNQNVTIQFEVIDPENSNSKLKAEEVLGLRASQHSEKILKCQLSIFNSMLPAELCTMIPILMRNMKNMTVRENSGTLVPKPLTKDNNSTKMFESISNRAPPKVLPFVISPILIKYREGRYTNVLNQHQTKKIVKDVSSFCIYNKRNVKDAQEILSFVNASSLIFSYCLQSILPSALKHETEANNSRYVGCSSTSLISRKDCIQRLDLSTEYFRNNMIHIMKGNHKIKLDFIYDFFNDVVSVKVNLSNATSNDKALIPFTKNIEENLSIINLKDSPIFEPDPICGKTGDSSNLGVVQKILPYEPDTDTPSVTTLVKKFEEGRINLDVPVRKTSSLRKDIYNNRSQWSEEPKELHFVIKKTSSCSRPSKMLLKKCNSVSSVHNTPLSKINKLDDFFRAMGAVGLSAAIDPNTSEVLISSVVQMKEWITKITPRQVLLVLLLANKKQTPNLIKFRTILLQAIAVNRITTASELDTEIEVLEKERLKLTQSKVIEESMNVAKVDNSNDLYEELCWIAKTTASDYQRTFDESSEKLLKSLLEKRKKLNPSYLRVMARYVGLGLVKSPLPAK